MASGASILEASLCAGEARHVLFVVATGDQEIMESDMKHVSSRSKKDDAQAVSMKMPGYT